MPWYTCYVIRRMPKRLLYRNGAIEFEFAREPFLTEQNLHWVFRARKIQALPRTCTIAFSMQGRWHLEQKLMGGFTLDANHPATAIMERLVREGYATKSREKFSR